MLLYVMQRVVLMDGHIALMENGVVHVYYEVAYVISH